MDREKNRFVLRKLDTQELYLSKLKLTINVPFGSEELRTGLVKEKELYLIRLKANGSGTDSMETWEVQFQDTKDVQRGIELVREWERRNKDW